MKKFYIIILTVFILCVSTVIALNSTSTGESESTKNTETQVCALTSPETFDSIEDFIASLPVVLTDDDKNESEKETYRRLLNIPADNYTLRYVSHREGVYIAARYDINNYEYKDEYSSSENELCSSAVYQIYLFEDPQKPLQHTYVDDTNYTPVEYNGKTYYYCPVYTSKGDFVAHSFGFVAENKLMYVCLPGSYTLDEALQMLY